MLGSTFGFEPVDAISTFSTNLWQPKMSPDIVNHPLRRKTAPPLRNTDANKIFRTVLQSEFQTETRYLNESSSTCGGMA